MIIFAFHACTHMVAAGDTWVAMACGRHFVNHGVDTVEPFSFNSHDAGPTDEQLEEYPQWLQPLIKKWHPTGWVNQNWLTQVIFYKLTTVFGSEQEPAYNMLVFWKFAINLLVIICLYFSSRLLGAGRLISAVLTCWAMYVSRSFIDIRPAVFSNMLVPLYVYILLLAVHKRTVYIYLLVPLLVFWSNVHGGYLYAFIIIVPFWLYYFVASHLKWKILGTVPRGLLLHTFFAGLFSFIAMVIFNPYHLTNLTHTFIITVSEHAKEWKNVNEWHSAFEFSNPVGVSKPFVAMFFIGLFFIFAWFWLWGMLRPAVSDSSAGNYENRYQWPAWPIIPLFIALFTCGMAIRSRRFIPIAAYTLVPVLAMMLTQMYEMILSRKRSGSEKGKNGASSFSVVISAALLVGVIVFGAIIGIKYKKIYLDPWPIDKEKTSVFMRMTASYAKPFRACDFIRENNLSGHMLNYWTEGGFVAYCQTPDPETGEIPLKLFMDGRAQAAYDIEMFQEYNVNILSGGDKGKELAALSKSGSKAEFRQKLAEVAEYLDNKLKEYQVWIILMPANQQKGLFMRAMTSRLNWKMVYSDSSQTMLVNVQDSRGKALLDGVFDGKTVFPDESYRDIVKAAYLAGSNSQRAFELASKAFEDTGSATALNYLFNCGRTPELQDKIYDYCKSMVSDYISNEEKYKNEDGFAEKITNVIMALNYISKNAASKEPQKAATYTKFAGQLADQRKELMKEYNW
ncbi:MAG: hypothetical protein ACIAQZ_10760 [Sedimentisphaeraceae bacterium JB056]